MWTAAGLSVAEARAELSAAVELLTPPSRGKLKEAAARASAGDRAAALKVMAFDQKPDECKGYIKLFDFEEESSGSSAESLNLIDPGVARIKADPEIQEGVRFAKRLQNMPSEAECTRSRLRRLLDSSALQGLYSLLASDTSDEAPIAVMTALEPLRERIYGAARTAQLRRRPAQEVGDDKVQVISLEFDLFGAIASLVVVIALAFFASQAFKGAISQSSSPGGGSLGGSNLPVYGLNSRGF
mmetsp:Transcript_10627/g.26392  ORF Transcript_10627/g.26392 Transcript_10627/m.26392 type:complete len:242 (+) Transcript_10627:2594-3319(+)